MLGAHSSPDKPHPSARWDPACKRHRCSPAQPLKALLSCPAQLLGAGSTGRASPPRAPLFSPLHPLSSTLIFQFRRETFPRNQKPDLRSTGGSTGSKGANCCLKEERVRQSFPSGFRNTLKLLCIECKQYLRGRGVNPGIPGDSKSKFRLQEKVL